MFQCYTNYWYEGWFPEIMKLDNRKMSRRWFLQINMNMLKRWEHGTISVLHSVPLFDCRNILSGNISLYDILFSMWYNMYAFSRTDYNSWYSPFESPIIIVHISRMIGSSKICMMLPLLILLSLNSILIKCIYGVLNRTCTIWNVVIQN